MYREIFSNKQSYEYLLSELKKLYSDFDWNTRLQFIYNKYHDYHDKQFDLHCLYMVTYSLRGNMNTSLDKIGLDVSLFTVAHNMFKNKCVIILTFKQEDYSNISIEYGINTAVMLLEYQVKLVQMFTYIGVNYKLVTELNNDIIQKCDKNSTVIIPLTSLLPSFNNNSTSSFKEVLYPIPLAICDKDYKVCVNNFILNVLNCCTGDTITNDNDKYKNIKYNIIVQ